MLYIYQIMNPNKPHKINQITQKSIQLPNLTYSNMNSPKIQPKSNSNAKHNANLTTSTDSKKGFIQFNMMRIMPNNISKDKEVLYQENIKLKQEITYLNTQIVRLKTRLSIFQKETNKSIQPNQTITKYKTNRTIQKINKINKSLNHMKNDSDKFYSSSKTPIVYLQNQNHLKSILRQSKDQQSTLKNQYQKLKKSLKYTQTCQLGIQIQQLHKQCQRLTNIIQKNSEQRSMQIKQYENKINSVKLQSQKLKQINIFLSTQLREKIVQTDSLKKELNKLNTLQEKYQKQLIQGKKSLQSQKQTNQTQNKSKQVRKKSSKKNSQKMSEVIFLHDSRMRSRSKTPSLQNNNQIKQFYFSQNNKKPNEEAQISQIMKQTITYRFKYHRYTYQNLVGDIQKANLQQFNIQQMKALLTHQPFYLSGQELETVLSYIFDQKNHQTIKTKQFLSKIKKLIITFELMPQEKQIQCLKKWKKIIRENQKVLRIKYAQKQFVSKQQLIKIIIETQIKDYQLQVLQSEASLIAKTMDNINFQLFLNKILE